MSRRSRWLALLAGAGLAFGMTSSVFAYHHQVPKTITVSPSSGTFQCDRWYTVRAIVLDQNGKPIKHLTVTWSFASSPSSHDKIAPSTSKTNEDGVASVRVKLACVAGDRAIEATTDGISGSAVVHESDAHHQHGVIKSLTTGAVLSITAASLPSTSTTPSDASTGGSPAPVIPALVALLAAAAIIVRRFALSRD